MKKLLVITPTNPLTSGGIQNLCRLLSKYPSEQLCVLTRFAKISNAAGSKNYNEEGRALNYYFYDRGETHIMDSSHISSDEIVRYKHDLLSLLFENLRRIFKKTKIFNKLIGPLGQMVTTILIIRKALLIIKRERIEAILGVSDGGPVLFSTFFVGLFKKIPYSVLIFDLYKENRLPFFDKCAAYLLEPTLFQHAKHIIVNNEGTKKFYEKHYRSLPLVLIHNSSDYTRYQSLVSPWHPHQPYKIVFTGSIYWAQERSLQNLITAVKMITDIPIKIHVYTTGVANKTFITKNAGDTVMFNTLSTSRMPEVQNMADILFLPLSWHTRYDDIINTATPGKLSDYLIAGRPILIHAPPKSFLVEYARTNNCAAIVDEERYELLIAAIKKLLTEIETRDSLVSNARSLFFKNHSAEKNAQKFLSLFA